MVWARMATLIVRRFWRSVMSCNVKVGVPPHLTRGSLDQENELFRKDLIELTPKAGAGAEDLEHRSHYYLTGGFFAVRNDGCV